MTVNELAARLEVAPTPASLMVGDLSGKGILDRQEDPADRRRRIVAIAPDQHDAIAAWPAPGATARRHGPAPRPGATARRHGPAPRTDPTGPGPATPLRRHPARLRGGGGEGARALSPAVRGVAGGMPNRAPPREEGA
ncbi:hypothetical protein [Streptomyces sp. NPDC057690]|uniref:hypothetical protein n=1 Tax=Streptomyces sp. NPDC057690 TaxID=3346214 RepID=UPI0036A595E7